MQVRKSKYSNCTMMLYLLSVVGSALLLSVTSISGPAINGTTNTMLADLFRKELRAFGKINEDDDTTMPATAAIKTFQSQVTIIWTIIVIN